MAERQGLVSEVASPASGKKMGSAKVGGRTVRFFWNEYETETPTQVRQRLEKAQAEAFAVLVTGEEMPNPKGQGPPMFKALEVARAAPGASQAPQNGSQSPTLTPPGKAHPLGYSGHDPGLADFWLATRWSWSLAAEMLVKMGKEPSVANIAELAGEIFQVAYSEYLKHAEWAAALEGEA